MSDFNWQVNSTSNFASFLIVSAHNSLKILSSYIFLLWMKRTHQSQNFGTLECCGENLPNFSCHFWNDESVFLQILHHSLVSWKITPLYSFIWNIIYFGQKQSIKVQTFETFQCSSQNSSNFLCQFWNDKSIPLQCFYYFSVSLHITPL